MVGPPAIPEIGHLAERIIPKPGDFLIRVGHVSQPACEITGKPRYLLVAVGVGGQAVGGPAEAFADAVRPATGGDAVEQVKLVGDAYVVGVGDLDGAVQGIKDDGLHPAISVADAGDQPLVVVAELQGLGLPIGGPGHPANIVETSEGIRRQAGPSQAAPAQPEN